MLLYYSFAFLFWNLVFSFFSFAIALQRRNKQEVPSICLFRFGLNKSWFFLLLFWNFEFCFSLDYLLVVSVCRILSWLDTFASKKSNHACLHMDPNITFHVKAAFRKFERACVRIGESYLESLDSSFIKNSTRPLSSLSEWKMERSN